MNTLRRSILLLFWLITATAFSISAHADTELDIIPSSRADELVPILAPLAAPEGSVSAWRDQLIIRATPDKMLRIRETLKAIDKPLRNLLVQVRRRGTDTSQQRSIGADGKVVIRNGRVSGQAVIRADDQQTQQQKQSEYSLRAIEGSTLFITTGSDIPVITFGYGPGGYAVSQDYVPVQSGMRVTPRLLADDTVLLTLDYQEASVGQTGHGTINRSGTSSQMQLRLNEWTPFGAFTSQESRQQSGWFGSSRQTTSSNTPLEIRVEIVP